MSSTIKRIALVAVASLTLGGFSAISAMANDPIADTLAAASTSVSATSNVKSTVAVTTGFLAQSNQSATRLTALLTAAPEGNTAVPTFETATVTGYTDAGSPVRGSSAGSTMITAGSANNTYTKATYNLAFTPVKSGTYTVRVSQAIGTTSSTFTASTTNTANAAAITITFTVATKPEVTAAASTEVASATGSGSGNDTDGVSASRNFTGANIATIAVSLANGSTTAAIVNGEAPAITASTNIGLISWDDSTFNKSVTSSSTNISQTLYVRADGTSGVATITFSYVNAAGTIVVLGTKNITFYGSAAKYTVTVTNPIISTASAAAASVGSTATPATPAYRAIKVVVTDAAGAPVTGATVRYNSSATSVISGAYTSCDATSDSAGVVYCSLTGNAAGTADLTFTNRSSATDTTPLVSAGPVKVRVGTATAKTVAISFDKDSYIPGEKATVTVNVKDADGNNVPNGVYTVFSSAATSNLALASGSLPGTAVTGTASGTFAQATLTSGQVWVTDNAGNATVVVNMPVTPGTVTVSATGASGLSTAQALATISGSAVVTSAADDAVEAANDATEAANAATDAANAAAEAADAATAAAQDAQAAVADLAAQVATLIAGIKAQITRLTNLVVKIQKKVRA